MHMRMTSMNQPGPSAVVTTGSANKRKNTEKYSIQFHADILPLLQRSLILREGNEDRWTCKCVNGNNWPTVDKAE